MSNSSQPKDSLNDLTFNDQSIEDLIKDCTIDLGAAGDMTTSSINYNGSTGVSTITLNTAIGLPAQTYIIGSLTSDTITINGIDTSQFKFDFDQEWQNCFPSWSRVQDMCEQYPGLKVAFENFKVFYEMVKDDYDNPTPKK